jgi:hypothetical protein
VATIADFSAVPLGTGLTLLLLMMRPSTKKVLQRVSQGFRSRPQLPSVPNLIAVTRI